MTTDYVEIVDGREARTILPDSPALREHMARALAAMLIEREQPQEEENDRETL